MQSDKLLSAVQRIGTGLAFIVFPIVFVFAFSVHPALLHPHLLGPAELILRARGDGLLQFAHALVTLDTALLVVVINLTASVLMAIAMVPYGVQILQSSRQDGEVDAAQA